MTSEVREYVNKNMKRFEFAKTAVGYSHFCMLCALEDIEPWSPSLYNACTGCIINKDGNFDIWKALAE